MDLSKAAVLKKRRKSAIYCTACRHNSNKSPSYSYFRFPKDDIRCNEWIDNLQLAKLSTITTKALHYTSRRVCSAHFEDCMFSNALHTKLKFDAVPKQFQEESEQTVNEKSNIEALSKEKNLLTPSEVPSLKLPKLSHKINTKKRVTTDLHHITEIINKDKNSIKIVPETLDKVCRLCLKEVGTINIFIETSRKKDTKYFELISKLSLAQVQENDDLPTKICKSCATKINDFCYFKEEVETAQVLMYIALGKVILRPLSGSSNFQNIDVISRKNVDVNSQSKNINVKEKLNYINSVEECETITIVDDKDVFGQINISEVSSNVETVNKNSHEIQKTENQNDKVDSQTNTVLTFKKDITGGSLLYNILANKDVEYNSTNNINYEEDRIEEEEIYDKTDINSIMQCWKSYLYCVACNSNPNTHPEVSFFNFPVDDERSFVWRQVMKLDRLSYLSALECHKRYRLCSKHFEQTMFSSKDNSRLKRTAIPTNFSEKKKIKKEKIETHSIGVQTESENDKEITTEVYVNEESTDDLLCPETMEEIETTTTPIEIMDHSYTRSINKVKKRTAFQCVSFNSEGKKIYTCVFCNEQFDLKGKYLSHKRREYLKRRPRKKIKITCTVCGKLVVRERLKGHMITHTELRPHICEFCGKTFRSGANLSDHKATHQEARYFCETCGKGFSVKRQLEAHVKVHDEGPCYICYICGFTSRSSQARSGHEKKHMLGKENFKQRNPFRGPRRQPPKTKECDVCQKMFPSNAHLAIHMRSHTGEKPYKCIECDKNFLHIGGLNSHKKIHAGLKNFECIFCSKKFTLNGNLQQHMRTHTGEKPHECEFCTKKFYTNSALRKHKKIHERNMYSKIEFD